MADNNNTEMSVTDVYEQAAAIGQEIEVIRNTHGSVVIENVMPKLIFVLDKLENLVAKHNDDTSKIQALLLEQADLTVRRNNAATEKKNAEKELENAESLVTVSERHLEMKMKYLKMENKELSKQLKKRNKKIKKIHNGGERSSAFWLLDKFLFSGRIFFMTVELPRDIETMRNVEATIESQKFEINRLSCEIEMKVKEKESVTTTASVLASANECLEKEAATMKKKLIEKKNEDGILQITDISFSNRKDYRHMLTENIWENNISVSGNVNLKFTRDNNDQSDSDVTISSISDETRYWGEVESSDTDEYPINFNMMTVLDATTGNRKYKINQFPCDDEIHEKEKESITNDTKDNMENEFSEINEVETNRQNEVKVDIHSNRKDYKKLSLAKELRTNIEITDEINLESTVYDLSDSDITMCSTADESRYYWGEVDSKSSDEEGHFSLTDVGSPVVGDNKNKIHRTTCKNKVQEKEQLPRENQAQVQNENDLISYDINKELSQLGATIENEIKDDIKESDKNKNFEPACDNYEQCDSDVIFNSMCYFNEDDTHKDTLTSDKRQDGHLYFILDKKAMAVKKVGREEYYQHALHKPLSPSKLSTTYDYQMPSRSLHV